MSRQPRVPPPQGEGDRAQRGGGARRSRGGGPAASSSAIANARWLRRELTLPEGLIWRALRARPHGLKFRRQHPCGPYVLDFFCPAARLAIEVDGAAHDLGGNWRRDEARDRYFAGHGVTTLRLTARDVLANTAAVLDGIIATALARRPLHPSPTASGPPPPSGEEPAYIVDVHPLGQADGGGFAAVAPELPGCRSDGETPEEALANAYDAIACWIEAAQEMGRAVPQPRRVAA